MIEGNGPGGMNTEGRSPMITSGVATPRVASNNITVVITIPATNPASKPAIIAFVLLTTLAPSYKLIGIRESICAPDGRDASSRGRSGEVRHFYFALARIFLARSITIAAV